MSKLEPHYLPLVFNQKLYLTRKELEHIDNNDKTEKAEIDVQDKQVKEEKVLPAYFPVVVITETPSKEDKTLLQNILKAVGLDLNMVSVIPPEKTGEVMRESNGIKVILDFTATSALYEIIRKTEKRILSVDPLAKLQGDKSLKLKLWGQLKVLFPN